MKLHQFVPLLFCMLLLNASAAQGAITDPGLTGVTQFDGWVSLTPTNFPGYGSFPGATPWPSFIGSNQASSADADLNRTAGNGTGGGPYLNGSGVYHGGFSGTANTFGGSLSVTDSTVVANLKNVVFQTQISEAFGYELFNDAAPVLNYNGGAQALAAVYSEKLQVDTGTTFPNPLNGNPEPLFLTNRTLQWDLSAIVGPITSISITWSGVQHSIIQALRLDQSDTFTPVPEPVSLTLLFPLALLRRRRR